MAKYLRCAASGGNINMSKHGYSAGVSETTVQPSLVETTPHFNSSQPAYVLANKTKIQYPQRAGLAFCYFSFRNRRDCKASLNVIQSNQKTSAHERTCEISLKGPSVYRDIGYIAQYYALCHYQLGTLWVSYYVVSRLDA